MMVEAISNNNNINVEETDTQVKAPDLTELFMDFINNFKDKNGVAIYKEELERVVRERKHIFMIDYRDLKKFNEALAKQFEDEPEKTIDSLVAYLLSDVIIDMDKDFGRNVVKDFTIGITGYDGIILSPSQVSIDYLDRLITVEGIISSEEQNKKKHVLKRAVIYYYVDDDGKVESTEPQLFKQDYLSDDKIYDKFCGVCGKRPIKIEFSEYDSIATDRRIAIIQDLPENMKKSQTIPESLILVLTREFADMLHVGDIVKVTGFLRTRKLEEGAKNTERYYFVVTGVEYEQMAYSNITLTQEDIRKIEEYKKNPEQFMRDFIDSIAPTLYGLERIKEAIALSLVGGNTVNLSDRKVRGDIHVLIIGEPGTGKTSLLTAIEKIAPKAIYVSGENTTKVGVSAGLDRDPVTGEWMIEAGALALANGGFVLLDEIDKMSPQDRVSLRESMEKGEVSVTKIKKARLKAETTVIAAGNPTGDRFSHGSIFQYIQFDVSLLSRFDLVFTLKEELDDKKIDFILDSTIKRKGSDLTSFMYNPPIPPEMMKKIIVYARTMLMPRFSEEAETQLKKMGKYIKSLSEGNENIKKLMSGRELHTLRRLAEAYAKLQLKEEVTVKEVKMAFDMIMDSLSSCGFFDKSEDEEES